MFFFSLHVGIQQRHIAFTSAPKGVALPAELYCCIYCAFHLSCSVGYNVELRVCRSPVHIARITEYIGRSPQEFYAGFFLPLIQTVGNFYKIFFTFGRTFPFGAYIPVMPAIIGRSDFSNKLKSRIRFVFGVCHRIRAAVPRKLHCSRPKGIFSCSAKRMPVGYCKTQMLFHRLT